ncbi:MAG: SMI1/KNR4 family protein [Byssovorax sp.]
MAALDFVRALRLMNVLPRTPLRAVAMAEWEQKLGRELPAELKTLYGCFDGVDVSAMPVTSQGIRVWPLSELRLTGPGESGAHGSCFVFADFLLSSIEYGFSLETNDIVLLDGAASQVVADELADFLRKCLQDHPSIYGERQV